MLTADEEAELDLSAEAECCNAVGIDYLSVPVADLSVPVDSTIFEAAVSKVVFQRRGNDRGAAPRDFSSLRGRGPEQKLAADIEAAIDQTARN